MAAAVKDYYQTLGVSKEASQDDIKKAFRKLARKYHPDLNPGNKAAEERFKEINEAYTVLGDPQKRAEYDKGGTFSFEGFEGFRSYDSGGAYDFGDIFSDLFGAKSAAEPHFTRGEDILMGIELTLNEAFTGVTKPLTVTRAAACDSCGGTGAEASQVCDKCRGSGRLQTSKGFFKMAQTCPSCGGTGRKITAVCKKCRGRGQVPFTETLNVKIPAGVDDGSHVKLKGKGNAGVGGGPPGDLLLEISIKPHPFFRRRGDDMHITLPVTFGEASLGGKIEVPTIDGAAMMTLPPGTQGGQRFKLSGKGFNSPKGGHRGDEYVEIRIVVPKGVTEKAREAIATIESLYRENPRKGMVTR